MQRFCLVFLMGLLAFSTNAQNTPKTEKDDECSIAGMVVAMEGSVPLRKARVVLQSTEDQARGISTVTTADGRFTLKGLAPGSYRLSVSRAGFVVYQYGQRKPGTQGAILTLRPKQEIKDLLFRLIPSGVISGKILDADGEPLPSASVQAMRQTYSEGKRTLLPQAMVETNDLGEYRLFGLAPGRYFVSAAYSSWRQNDAPSAEVHEEGYAKIYYPGTPEAAKAGSLTIKPGEEVSSIEIMLRQVTVHRIRGHVFNQITNKPGEGVILILIPKSDRHQWDSESQTDVRKPDGSFEIPDVPPGSYVLVSYWFGDDKYYMNRQVVEVGNADVDGITITVAPGAAISGRIVWDGKPSMEKDELQVIPQPVDLDIFRGSARVTRGNTFLLKDIGEGTYRTDVIGMSKDCYLKDVRFGESSVMKDGFTVMRGTSGNLEITISSHGARVEGAVVDGDGLPEAGASVVLIPDSSRRDQFRLYKTQSTDQYGHFAIRGIAPGDYKLFAWEEVEADAWQAAEFLKPFEVKGESITLRDDDKSKMTITAISAKSVDAAKP
jgi:protocatechuate 3,4-dioxygenase beta subunit